MAEEFSLTAKLLGDNSGLASALEGAQGFLKGFGVDVEKMTEEGSGLFKKFGVNVDEFAGKFGLSAPLLVGVAAAGAALFEVGKEVFEVGNKFDESFSLIGKSTGAIGPQLRDLSDGFVKVVGSGVVQGIDDLASAFALLAQKLDVTGEELQNLTVDFSKFADVNRTSVTESVREVTQVMNEWNVETEDAVELMDQLTRAAQITGLPVSQLTQSVLSSSAQFKQLGLSLTDSIGFLTAFDKAGADVSSTTRALNTAVVNLSASGGNVAERFKDTIASIQSAQSPQEALNQAVELFGSRAAPKMVDALRNAKFDLAGFTAAIAEAGGTVEKTNEQTESFGDKWAAFGNKVMAAVAPIGEVLVSIGKVIVDVLGVAFDELSKIATPVFGIIQGLFRDVGDTVQAVVGTVKDLIEGNWRGAWDNAQLIMLNVAKAVLDIASGIVNTITGMVNAILTPLNTVLVQLGQKAIEIAKVDLAQLTGVAQGIREVYADLSVFGEKTTKELGVQSIQREKIFSDEAKTYDISIRERIKASLALEDAYETQMQAEKGLSALALQAATASSVAAKTFQANATLISGTIDAMISGPFQALGAALVNGGNLWQALGHAAVHSIGTVVKALGDQMAAKAALDLAQAIAYSTNPFTAAAAPGYYGQAAIEFGAATAAYTAAGALSAFETGTPYSTGGAARLAEAGPELVMSPSVHNLVQGSVVLNAKDTMKAMGSGKGATLNFNVGNITRESVGATMRRAESMSRRLAFEGVL
jgi:TP901 family phage tail tape measure protein